VRKTSLAVRMRTSARSCALVCTLTTLGYAHLHCVPPLTRMCTGGDWVSKCRDVLNKVLHALGPVKATFYFPVEATILPDYYTIITKPIFLQDVESRLNDGTYTQPQVGVAAVVGCVQQQTKLRCCLPCLVRNMVLKTADVTAGTPRVALLVVLNIIIFKQVNDLIIYLLEDDDIEVRPEHCWQSLAAGPGGCQLLARGRGRVYSSCGGSRHVEGGTRQGRRAE